MTLAPLSISQPLAQGSFHSPGGHLESLPANREINLQTPSSGSGQAIGTPSPSAAELTRPVQATTSASSLPGLETILQVGSASLKNFSGAMHKWVQQIRSGRRLQPSEMVLFMAELQTHSMGMQMNIHVAGKASEAIKQLANQQ